MALFAKDPNEILQQALDYVKAHTPITSTSPGSKFRALLEVMKKELNEAYLRFDANLALSFVYGAEGRYLDYLGDIFGVKRLRGLTASVDATAEKIKFYVVTGTFGSINGGNSISIPAGTRIYGTKNGTKVYYTILSDTLLDAGLSEKYVSAQALEPGIFSNVASGVLTNIDGLNINGLKVTNVDSIDSGFDEESDSNYKSRILNQRLLNASANETAIKMAALGVPGVSDAVIITNGQGASSGVVYVKTTEAVASQSILNKVQSAVDSVSAFGSNIKVFAPVYYNMSFTINLSFSPSLTELEKSSIASGLRLIAADYINNLDVGATYNYDYLSSMLLSYSDRISKADLNLLNNIKFTYSLNGYNASVVTIKNFNIPLYGKLIIATNDISIIDARGLSY